MKDREFGRTGWRVGEIGFGAWAIGGSWGNVSEEDAVATLHAALDSGVTFLDTADVYGDGRSERLIARVLKERGTAERPIVATKAGRRLSPHTADGYTLENLEGFVDRSLKNLEMETLDLVQLHCPPTEVFDRPEVFGAMDRLVEKGKIRFHGVSVERIDEALRAIRQANVASVQIIYNLFRQRPADDFFPAARAANVGVVVRVPLASGLLTGRIDRNTEFAKDDHRNFNRHGESFDVGETFSGVPFEAALEAVEALRAHVPEESGGMAAFALRWILMEDAVSVVIPGGRREDQARGNARASELDALPAETMAAAREIYDRVVAPHVHARW